MSESSTGRGYVQGSSSYREDDAAWECREQERIRADKARKVRVAAMEKMKGDAICTCRNSTAGMDVDRCPVHGEGCA